MATTVIKIFNGIFLLSFSVFALVGYSYFGPYDHTAWLTNQEFFQRYVTTRLDRILLSIGTSNGIYVGRLSIVRGDLRFRPTNELVFLPARLGQRLHGGTFLSTGARSSAVIKLLDDSEIRVEPNSTLLLSAEDRTSAGADAAITLKILQGRVTAEKLSRADSASSIKLVTPGGKTEKLATKKLVVLAPEVKVDPRRVEAAFVDFVKESVMQSAEYIGSAEAAPTVEQLESKVSSLIDTTSSNLNLSSLQGSQSLVGASPAGFATNGADIVAPEAEKSSLSESDLLGGGGMIAPATTPAADAPKPNVDTAASSLSSDKIEKALNEGEALKAAAAAERKRKQEELRRKEAARKAEELRQAKIVAERERKQIEEWIKLNGQTPLAGALLARMNGDSAGAMRLFRQTLSNREYASVDFNDGQRLAWDGIFQELLGKSPSPIECELARGDLDQVRKRHPNDPKAERFLSKWTKLHAQKCPN